MGWPPHPPHRAMLLLPWGFGKKRLEVSCEAEDKWEISHQWLPDWNHCEFYAKPTFTSVVRRSGQQEKNGLAKRRRCSYGALHPQKPFKTVDSPSMHRGLIPAPRSWDSPSMHRVANTLPPILGFSQHAQGANTLLILGFSQHAQGANTLPPILGFSQHAQGG